MNMQGTFSIMGVLSSGVFWKWVAIPSFTVASKIVHDVFVARLDRIEQKVEAVDAKVDNLTNTVIPKLEEEIKQKIEEKGNEIKLLINGDDGLEKKLSQAKIELLKKLDEDLKGIKEEFPTMKEELEKFIEAKTKELNESFTQLISDKFGGLTKEINQMREAIGSLQSNVIDLSADIKIMKTESSTAFAQLQKNDENIEQQIELFKNESNQKLDEVCSKQIDTLLLLRDEFKHQAEELQGKNDENSKRMFGQIVQQYSLIQENITQALAHKFVTHEQFQKVVNGFNEKLHQQGAKLDSMTKMVHETYQDLKTLVNVISGLGTPKSRSAKRNSSYSTRQHFIPSRQASRVYHRPHRPSTLSALQDKQDDEQKEKKLDD